MSKSHDLRNFFMKVLGFFSLFIVYTFLMGCSSINNFHLSYSESAKTDPYSEFFIPHVSSENDLTSRKIITKGQFDIDENTLEITINNDRDLLAHFKIDSYIPPPRITVNGYDSLTGILDVNVTIENTFNVDGFDPRVIIYTDNDGVRLTNPDGWTSLWDIPGGASANPFVAFAKMIPMRRFASNSEFSERMLIYLPGSVTIVRYAIDISYPDNCHEPYSIENFIYGNLYDDLNSEASVYVDVYDHQNDVDSVSLYCPPITGNQFIELGPVLGRRWTGTLTNSESASEGIYNGFIAAKSSDQYIYRDVKIEVLRTSQCGNLDNGSYQTAAKLQLEDSVTGCVDLFDEAWYVVYTPPMSIKEGTISLEIIQGGIAGMTVWASNPGSGSPGNLIHEGTHLDLGAMEHTRFFINIIGIDDLILYELSIDLKSEMANVDVAVFVATDDGTWEGTWPVNESVQPNEELTPSRIRLMIDQANGIWNPYGYHLEWDNEITIIDSKYYILEDKAWEMHDTYGRGTNKICMYFEQSTPTAWCIVHYLKQNQNVDSVFSVYGPNCWTWESVVAHEWGHGFGYLFDQYIYSSHDCPCGDNVCIGQEPWLYWCDDGCYAGNLMWYAIIGWTYDMFDMTGGQAQFVNHFHFQYPNNFPWYK